MPGAAQAAQAAWAAWQVERVVRPPVPEPYKATAFSGALPDAYLVSCGASCLASHNASRHSGSAAKATTG